MSMKIDSSVDIISFFVGVGLDVAEFGTIWDVEPGEIQNRTGVLVRIPANTDVPYSAGDVMEDGWKDTRIPGSIALPVPIPRPGDKWSYEGYRRYCSAEGDLSKLSESGITPFATSHAGELLFKFGREGRALPVYNGGHADMINDTGSMHVGINVPADELHTVSGSVTIALGMFRPSNQLVTFSFDVSDGWLDMSQTRRLGWADFLDDIAPKSDRGHYLTLEAPAVAQRGARWNINYTLYDGTVVTECGPNGVNSQAIEGDSRFPYSGEGARYGQLIYSWGGVVRPVWHGGASFEEYSGEGHLYMRMNDSEMGNNQGYIHVLGS
ncbi:hypothetical protein ACW9IK_03740 [Pseudomonas gingeri]